MPIGFIADNVTTNAEIAKYEVKSFPPSCDYCGMDLPSQSFVSWSGYKFCDNACENSWHRANDLKSRSITFAVGDRVSLKDTPFIGTVADYRSDLSAFQVRVEWPNGTWTYENEKMLIKQPKPFGPGTRLRAANGDELVVIASPGGGQKASVNLTRNTLLQMKGGSWYFELDELKRDLLDSGAEVVG